MSVERLRNVVTGEIRDIETTSEEYLERINEVYDHQGSARPMWEITGLHHSQRIDNDDVGETDLGYKFKPIPGAEVDISGVGPEIHPERAITEGEHEMGIENYEQKQEGITTVASSADNTGREVQQMEEVAVEDRREQGEKAAGASSRKSSRSQRSAKTSDASSAPASKAPATGSGPTESSGSSGSGGSGSSSSGGSDS